MFGGGGAKAIAHVGAWKAIQEVGGEVTHIVATSLGAVIGAALAAGATPDEVAIAARSLSRKDVAPLDAASLLKGVPSDVPPIVPETPDEKRRYDRAAKRRASRVMDRRYDTGAGE